MSYDVWLTVDAGGPGPAVLDGLNANYTSNCAGMMTAATGTSLQQLDGAPADDAARVIRDALRVMDGEPERFRAMEPDNHWGSFEGWHAYLLKIAVACEAAPDARLRVSY